MSHSNSRHSSSRHSSSRHCRISKLDDLCNDLLDPLILTKTVDNPAPNVGDSITFTIIASNPGPGTAPRVTISDNVPNGFTIQSTSPGCIISGQNVSSFVGNIHRGDSVAITITVLANAAGTYTNTATAKAVNGETASASVDVTVSQSGALTITKTVSPSTINVDDPVTFSINLNNTGPAASSIILTDIVPLNFNFITTPCVVTGHEVVCNVGTLNTGDNITIMINAVAVAAGNFTNTANITYIVNGVPTTASASVMGSIS